MHRWVDINVNPQQREVRHFICLNKPLSNGFLLLYEMLREFQKHGPETSHDVHTLCQTKND